MTEQTHSRVMADAVAALRAGGFVPVDEAATMLGCPLRDIAEKVNRASLVTVQVTAFDLYTDVDGHRMPRAVHLVRPEDVEAAVLPWRPTIVGTLTGL